MIRRLIILLLIFGCVFGDTIVFEQMGNTHTYDNVKFIKAGNKKVYFTIYGKESSRNCNQIIEFTDDDGNPIDYDCSVVIDEPQIKGKTKLDNSHQHFIEAGEKLIKFRSKYYRGFTISIIGQGLLFMGAINSEKAPMIAGGVISFVGGIIMFSSFNEAGEAGKELIKAGEILKTEQESN